MYFQEITYIKASLHDIKTNQQQTEGLHIGATLSKIQEDISALKTEVTKAGLDQDALYTDLKNQNSVALRVLKEVKEENIRIKRAFDNQKRLIADHIDDLTNQVRKLDNTLVDVNSTLSSFIPALIVNFDNAKNDFISTLNGTRNDLVSTLSDTRNDFASTLISTRNDFVSTLSGTRNDFESTLIGTRNDFVTNLSGMRNDFVTTLSGTRNDFVNTLSGTRNDFATTLIGTRNDFVTTLQTMELKLSNITSEVVKMGQDFNDTLTNVEENVKTGISTFIKKTFDEKMNALENSLSYVFEAKMNSMKYSLESGYTSALSTKISDLKSYIYSRHTSVLSKVGDLSSSIMSRFSTIQVTLYQIKSLVEEVQRNTFVLYWIEFGYDESFWPSYDRKKDIRIANYERGDNWVQGRLEVFNGAWGTICDDDFDNLDATIACNQIVYGSRGRAYGEAEFGEGKRKILLDNVECSGNEDSIFDCKHSGVGVHNCKHDEDVGIYCTW